MTVGAVRTDQAVSFDRLTQDFPPPPVFFEERWLDEPERIEARQLERLRLELARASRIPFFRDRWDVAGVDFQEVQTLDDLSKLPAYTSDDLVAAIERKPPWGDHQDFVIDAGRRGEPISIFFSDGTTGTPRPSANLQWDLEVLGILTSRVFWLAGIRPGDVVLNAWAYGTHAAAPFMDKGLRWNGAIPITVSSGSVTSSTKQLELAHRYGARSICAIGNHLVHLAEVAPTIGLHPQKDFSMVGFPGPAAGQSRRIETLWGVPSYESYGFNECAFVGVECPERGGMHIMEDAYIVQVVDVETGEPLPEGKQGNLVVTSLFRAGSAQVRYNVRDLTTLYPRQQCECGSWFRKVDYYRGRSDTMVKLRGTNVWPDGVAKVATEHPSANGEWYIDVYRDGSLDEMCIHLEVNSDESDWQNLTTNIEGLIREQLGIRIGVVLARPGQLEEFTGSGAKRRRFRDSRA